ncbi:hypothetical protein STEG23_012307, partial [Scotinomys teguina]
VLRGEIAPLKENVNRVNDLASQLTTLGIQLSPYNLSTLEDLNTRWKLLQDRTKVHEIVTHSKLVFLPQLPLEKTLNRHSQNVGESKARRVNNEDYSSRDYYK